MDIMAGPRFTRLHPSSNCRYIVFTTTDNDNVWKLISCSRSELADFLAGLDQTDWDHPSLCVGWRVRDVVAHLILEYNYQFPASLGELARSGFRLNKFMCRTAQKLGQQPTAALLDQFRATINQHHHPAGVPPLNVLVDLLVHEQDIQRGLGRLKAMPTDAVKLIFSHWQPKDFNFGERITGVQNRVQGLSFRASDITAQVGSGPEVSGPSDDILMVMLGRQSATKTLHGNGLALLCSRLK